jgi:hypothetical protein
MIDPHQPNNFHDVDDPVKKSVIRVEVNESDVRELITGKPAADTQTPSAISHEQHQGFKVADEGR